jgi:ankyrin repeat protein
VSDDHSLFAWESFYRHGGLLATSPVAFVKSSKIIPLDSSNSLSGSITVNNKGIHLKLRFTDGTPFDRAKLAFLPCTVEGELGKNVGIYLRSRSGTEEYFVRIKSSRLELIDVRDFSRSKYPEKQICVRQEHRMEKDEPSLTRAANNGHETMLRLLLEKGADLNIEEKDGRGRTPLEWAAVNGHEAVVKLLLEKVADTNVKDGCGRTALWWAAENGHEATVKLLLDKGDDTNIGDGRALLVRTVENGHAAVVKRLLETDAHTNVKKGGW